MKVALPRFPLVNIGFQLMRIRALRLDRLASFLERAVSKAYMNVSHLEYLAVTLARTVVGGSLAAAVGSMLWFLLYPDNPVLILLFTFVGGSATALSILGASLAYPLARASKIKLDIEKNLVYVVNYMAILASAGALTEEIFASLAKTGKIFGIAPSAARIIRDVELLGKDIYKAMDEESLNTPSKDYAELLQGLIATVSAGGKPEDYLKAMSKKYIENRRRLLSELISRLSLIGEVYVAALVALPIIFTSMLVIMGLFGVTVIGAFGPREMLIMLSFLLMPFLAMAILVIIDSMMAAWG